ncbi:MAG: BatA and WFA domain-containing protein, partial [Myxococcota bacterium]|nr:BatA and WFA domain-containing protein [Myxococcota bacterium]
MGLSLATPWMLFGLALLALPVVAHLTGYQEVRRLNFPTLRFLEASVLKVRRRRRVEALLLLLLRAGLLAALVFMFCRPSLTWTARALAGTDPSRATLVLIDRSASMSSTVDGESVLERAREEAELLLSGLDRSTLAGIMPFDSQPQLLPPGMTAERAPLRRGLSEIKQGAGGTDLDRAFRRARDVLRDAGIARANIFVLSDGTAGTLPGDLSEAWPPGLTVHYHDLLARDRSNRWVEKLTLRSGDRRGEGLQIRADIGSVGGGDGAGVSLQLPGPLRVMGDIEFDGTGRGEARFALPVPPEGSAPATLRLSDDDLPADDEHHFTIEGDTQLEVLLVSGDGGSNPRDDEVYYLDKALQPGAGSTSRIRPRAVSAEELRRIEGGPGSAIFLCNVADPGPLVGELERFVRAGGGLFVSVGNRVDPDRYNEVLSGLLPARFTEVKTRGRGTFERAPVGLSVPPLDEEEFRVFRSGGARAFSRVEFAKVLGTEPRIQDNSRVLLRYSDGLPALLERR